MINKSLTQKTEATSLNSTDLYYSVQGTTDKKVQLETITNYIETLFFNTSVDRNFVGTVQAIQNATVNSSNEPNFLTESSGEITLDTTITFRANIGDGYSDLGKQVRRINATSDLTIDLSAEADDDYYIILDYNDSTQTLSLESLTTARVMSTTSPSSPSSGDLWYDINNNKMFESDGSSWTQCYKIVLGMVNKSGATYTIYNRAFNDYYYDEFSVALDNRYLKSHNIFTDNINAQLWHYDNEGSPSAGWIQNFINRDELGGATRSYGASFNLLDRTIDVRYNNSRILESLSAPSGYAGDWIYPAGTTISATTAKLIVKRSF